MATSFSPRVGLMRWTDNSDPYPTRAEWDAEQNVLENVIAVWRGQGTLANRPAASVPGGFYVVPESDYATMYYDTGSKWIELATIGGVTPNGITVAGSNSQGTSTRAARADHTHTIPLVTSSAHGAMRKEDKAKLDAATSSPTSSTVVYRDGNGRSSFASVGLSSDPTGTTDATRKGYVDAQVAGVQSTLDAGTNLPTPNTLVKRDSAGRYRAVDPVNVADVATKGYADSGDANNVSAYLSLDSATNLDNVHQTGIYRAITAGSVSTGYPLAVQGVLAVYQGWTSAGTRTIQEFTPHSLRETRRFVRVYFNGQWNPWRELAGTETATGSTDGLMSKVDKALLDGATTNETPGTLVRRSAAGTINLQQAYILSDPTNPGHIGRKAYVDAGDSAARSYADTAISNIPDATTSVRGLMSTSDKSLLDEATHIASTSGSRLVRRDSQGRYRAHDPVDTFDVVNKRTMEAGDAGRFPFRLTPNSTDANAIVEFGQYAITSTTGWTNNPISAAATLEVLPFSTSTGNWIIQRWTSWVAGQTYTRASNDGGATWKPWREHASTDVATSSSDGLMSRSDKSTLDAATATDTANTIVRRNSAGNFSVAEPLATTHPTTKAYVDSSVSGAVNPVKSTVDAATSVQTANTLVRRDSSGRFRAANPSATTDVANKSYVDSTASSAQSAAETTAANALAPVKSTADAAKALTDAATSSATANTLVRRDSAGRFKSGTPSATTDVANKSYVDSRANTAQSNAETTAASALAPVKATVDGATSNANANRLMQRDSSGRVSVGTPTSTSHAATKGYVDGRDNTIQTALDALAYKSGARRYTHSSSIGVAGSVTVSRVGYVVTVVFHDFSGALPSTGGGGFANLSGSTAIPPEFRPPADMVSENSKYRLTAEGNTQYAYPGNLSQYAATFTYVVTADPPSSFTWGDPV